MVGEVHRAGWGTRTGIDMGTVNLSTEGHARGHR